MLPIAAYLIGASSAPKTTFSTKSYGEAKKTSLSPNGKPTPPNEASTSSPLDKITNPSASSAEPILSGSIAIAAPQEPIPRIKIVEIKSGDNLMDVLVSAGAEPFDAHAVIQSLRDVYDPRRDLRIGDELQLTLSPVSKTVNGSANSTADALKYVLSALRLPVSYNREVLVDLNEDGGFDAREMILPLEDEIVRVEGTIDSSLFINARDAGLPISVLVELVRVFSFDVDFQRDIWRDDTFEVMFERQRNQSGEVVNNGEILYAKLVLRSTELPLYRFKNSQGNIDYFNEKGEGVRKALMKTPIDGARLSSRFGKRKHPILGYTRQHSGVDFAAPTGTPIYAAGDGSVVQAGTNGSYGKYIKIRHNGIYSTAYAHLSGYARGVRRGKRVRQGQVIGYVGSTGRSTGPHLHYEIHHKGKKINPLALKLPSGETLKGERLASFLQHRKSLDAQYAELAGPRFIAETIDVREDSLAD